MTVTPDVSVIIGTRDRSESLKACLDSIQKAQAEASDVSVELIVVDNGSTDDTISVVQKWNARRGMTARLISEPRKGLSIARNSGAAQARGDILVFTDDDCCLSSDYFRHLACIYASINRGTLVGGRIELGDERDIPMTIKPDKRPATFKGIDPGTFVAGCNMTINREAWQKVGQFDTRLGPGSPLKAAEDTDYVYRAYLSGIPVHYMPDLCVYHFHGRRTLREAQDLMRAYSIGNGALYAKYFRTPYIRQLRWNCKNAFWELFNRAQLDPKLGLTYRGMIWGNMRGMALYWWGIIYERSKRSTR